MAIIYENLVTLKDCNTTYEASEKLRAVEGDIHITNLSLLNTLSIFTLFQHLFHLIFSPLL